MKNKIFLTMLMLLSLSNFSNMSATAKPEQLKEEQKVFLQVKTKTKKAVELLKACSIKTVSGSKQALVAFKDLFKFIVDKADKLTSKKVFIATMMTVGPAIALYCKYFNPEPLQNLLAKFFSSTTEGAVKVGTPIAQGIVEGASKGLLSNKKDLFKIAGVFAGYKVCLGIISQTIAQTGILSGPIIASKLGHITQFIFNKSTPLFLYAFTLGKFKTGYLVRP